MGAADSKEQLEVGQRLIAELEAENDVKSDHITALVTVTNRLAATIEQIKAKLDEPTDERGVTWWAWIKDGLGGTLHDDLRSILAAADTSVLADRDAEKWDEGEADGIWNREHEAMIERGLRKRIPNPYRREEPKP